MAEGLVIDPTSEDAANVPLDLVDGTNTFLLEASYPVPDRDQMWAPSADTEGDPLVQTRYRNRVITVKVRVVGSSAANLQTQLKYFQQKVAKVSREGGTLKRTAPSGSTVVFDLVGGSLDIPIDRRHLTINRAEVMLTFEAKPFGRGTAVVGSAHTETTLPVLVFTETGIAGDVPALGQLEITESQGVDQAWVRWGLQSRYYSSAATAKLFYEAEDLTPLGTSALNAGPSGASGSGGNKVIRSGSLTTQYQVLLSTQASGGGSHLSHIGAFNVYARVQAPGSNTGELTFALQWAQGDFMTFTTNAAVEFPSNYWDASWRLIDLGQVVLSPVSVGTQRWEGRILAKSTVTGDTVDIDHLFLVPFVEGDGCAKALVSTPTPTSISGRDEFNQTAGNLNGKTAPAGGTWATSGDATDLAVTGSGTTTRSVNTDTSQTGRLALLGTTTYTAVDTQVDFAHSALSVASSSLRARYVDSNNFLELYIVNGLAQVQKKVAGVYSSVSGPLVINSYAAGSTYTLRLQVAANGRFWAWAYPQGTEAALGSMVSGSDLDLATGGALASGKVGFNDRFDAGTGSITRTYDNFFVSVPTSDAAVFASAKARVNYDGYIRQDATAAAWGRPTLYEGDYLLVPPAGREGRTSRFIVKACRNDPETMADAGVDDISATLTYTPRYLVVPE